MLGDDVVVHVMEIVGNSVRVGIQAPRSLPVYREEIWDAVRQENRGRRRRGAPTRCPRPRTSSRLTVSCHPLAGYGLRLHVFGRRAASRASSEQTLMARVPPSRRQAAADRRRGRRRRRGARCSSATRSPGCCRRAPAASPRRPRRPRRPQPSNYDAPGPVANTATPVPAPDPRGARGRDRRGGRGGRRRGRGGRDRRDHEPTTPAPSSASPPTRRSARWPRPARASPRARSRRRPSSPTNAEFRDDAPSDAERQIEDTIEQADQPQAGETPEPVVSTRARARGERAGHVPPAGAAPAARAPRRPTETPPPTTPGGGISGRPFAGLRHARRRRRGAAEPTRRPRPRQRRRLGRLAHLVRPLA